MKKYYFLFLSFCSLSLSAQWQKMESGTEASFRSLDVVSEQVIWAGGSQNTVLRSIDGGLNWHKKLIKHDPVLDFRGIVAFDDQTAIVVSAGLAENNAAHVFKTRNGGYSWEEVFETDEEGVFLDGIAFFDSLHGLIIGDPLHKIPYLLETKDGGDSWERLSIERFPVLEAGEASFAASNSCLVIHDNKVWYALQSRILFSKDRGITWEILNSDFPHGESDGIFGLHFWTGENGILLGGDYRDDQLEQINISLSQDGGKSWKPMTIKADGLKESAVFINGKLIVVGTSGTSLSSDLGEIWKELDTENFHVIDCAGNSCFAIGARGNLGFMRVASEY